VRTYGGLVDSTGAVHLPTLLSREMGGGGAGHEAGRDAQSPIGMLCLLDDDLRHPRDEHPMGMLVS